MKLKVSSLKELKKIDGKFLATQIIVKIKFSGNMFECLDPENKEYEFNSPVSSKLFIAGVNPGLGWYRCIKCNKPVFIAKNRATLHDCIECNGYQFMQI
jgi:hypothetical protein